MEEGGNSARQVIELEREALQLRRELQDARAKKEESDQKFHQYVCLLLCSKVKYVKKLKIFIGRCQIY